VSWFPFSVVLIGGIEEKAFLRQKFQPHLGRGLVEIFADSKLQKEQAVSDISNTKKEGVFCCTKDRESYFVRRYLHSTRNNGGI
jgi:hypothetical protein